MSTVFGAVGLSDCRWGFLSSNLRVQGTNKALANGGNSGMGKLLGVTQAGLQKAAARNVIIPGNNGIFGAIKIAASDLSQGQILANAKNPVFTTGSQGTKLVAFGASEIALDGIPCPTYEQMCIIVNAPAISSDGVKGWSVSIYFNVQVDSLDNDIQDGNPHQHTHNLLGSLSSKFPWGEAFVAATHGSTLALRTEPFFSLYPLNIHTLKRNTGVTTVTLDETPAGETDDFVMAWDNGTAMTYAGSPATATEYNVVAATKVVTVGLAGTVGHDLILPYFYLPSC